MNYHNFPSQRPDEEWVAERAADAVCQFYRPCVPDPNDPDDMVDYTLISDAGTIRSHILTLPKAYSKFILALLYRRFALAKMLHHHQTEAITPYRFWVTLAQNFLHVDHIWDRCLRESDKSNKIDALTISAILDKYIVTEVLVRRHEPVYVSRYRETRTPNMPNISQATLADIGESVCPVYTKPI